MLALDGYSEGWFGVVMIPPSVPEQNPPVQTSLLKKYMNRKKYFCKSLVTKRLIGN